MSRAKKTMSALPTYGHPCAVAVSGGDGSGLLLDLMHRVLDCGRRRRPIPAVMAVHVDTAMAGVGDPVPLVAAASIARGIPCLIIPLRAAFMDEEEGVAALSTLCQPPGPVPPPAPVSKPRRMATAPPAVAMEHVSGSTDVAADGGSVAPCTSTVAPLPPPPPVTASAAAPTNPASVAFDPHGAEVMAAVATAMASMTAACATPAAEAAAGTMRVAFSRLATRDGRQELLDACVRRLVAAGARRYGIGVIMTGQCADVLAVEALYATCTGRGYAAPALVAPHTVDVQAEGAATAGSPPLPLPFDWYATLPPVDVAPLAGSGSVHWVRPLMEVEGREVALAAHVIGLQVSRPPGWVTAASGRDSLRIAVRDLVASLQSTYGGTVHNICRTLRKAPAPDGGADARACALCGVVLPVVGTAYAASSATAADLVGMDVHARHEPLTHILCHGCLSTIRDAAARGTSGTDRGAPTAGMPASVGGADGSRPPSLRMPMAPALVSMLEAMPTDALQAIMARGVRDGGGHGLPSAQARRAWMRSQIAEYLLDEGTPATESEGEG